MDRFVIGRAVSAVGITFGLLSIWIDVSTDGSGGYWSVNHHQLGIFMLVLNVLAAVLLVVGLVAANAEVDRLIRGIGFVLLGVGLFIPIGGAFDSWGRFDAGAHFGWIGPLLLVSGSLLAATGGRVSAWRLVRDPTGSPPPASSEGSAERLA